MGGDGEEGHVSSVPNRPGGLPRAPDGTGWLSIFRPR